MYKHGDTIDRLRELALELLKERGGTMKCGALTRALVAKRKKVEIGDAWKAILGLYARKQVKFDSGNVVILD
jgi:hypothetical protein